jgi:hypothetical protein
VLAERIPKSSRTLYTGHLLRSVGLFSVPAPPFALAANGGVFLLMSLFLGRAVAMDWYLKIANKELGPFSSEQLKTMAQKGQLSPEDLVRQGDRGPWTAAGRVRGLLAAAATSADSTPPPALKTAVPLNPPPVLAPPPPSIAGMDANVSAPAPSSPVAATTSPAEAKRKRKRRQKTLFVGLLGALIALTVVAAVIVVFNTGRNPAESADARKTNASNPDSVTSREHAAFLKDAMQRDPLEVAEAALAGITATAAASSSKKEGDHWTAAPNGSVTRGKVTVRVEAVELGQVRFTRATETCLAICVELTNTDDAKICQFTPRNGMAGLTLVDDLGNRYRLRSASRKNESIYPGRSLTETFFFQPPVAKAGFLRLQWPAAAFGEEGLVRFHIPVSMIEKVDEAAEEEPPGSEQPRPDVRQGPKKSSAFSSLQKEIEELGGGGKEEEVADFESDPEAAEKIEQMRQQAQPQPARKSSRRSRD